jgi:5-methylcytosine-specific restriction enzyme subunit McrC
VAQSNLITITEYQRIVMVENLGSNYISVTKKQFDALEAFVLSNELENASNYLKIGQAGKNKFLQAQNHIGVIQLKDGLTIEILPKIATKNGDNNHDEVRGIVIKMLSTLRNSPFKQVNSANLKAQKMPLLEVFIGMFMDVLELLIRRGIKNDYITREENSPFLKGKLLFSEHLKRNLAHKERFYVAYDNYQANRIENRIIKTTLQHLYKLSRSSKNQQRIREALFVFDEMKPVHDVAVAFSQVKSNRQMKDYEQVLVWSRLFLLGDSFTPHKGNTVAFALMFDMNQLFESYVGAWLKRTHNGAVSLQHSGKYLAVQEGGKDVFALRPDIVIDDGAIVADTKWKLLTARDKDKTNISQADMYQMFAYANKYEKCKHIVLIYPKTEEADNIKVSYCFKGASSVPVEIKFFDLEAGFDQSNELSKLLGCMSDKKND